MIQKMNKLGNTFPRCCHLCHHSHIVCKLNSKHTPWAHLPPKHMPPCWVEMGVSVMFVLLHTLPHLYRLSPKLQTLRVLQDSGFCSSLSHCLQLTRSQFASSTLERGVRTKHGASSGLDQSGCVKQATMFTFLVLITSLLLLIKILTVWGTAVCRH